jgi:hypothetical protein
LDLSRRGGGVRIGGTWGESTLGRQDLPRAGIYIHITGTSFSSPQLAFGSFVSDSDGVL